MNLSVIRVVHLFIHYEDSYSAPLGLLLRSAPDPNSAENNSFKMSIERVRVNKCITKGNPFQFKAPTTEKVLVCEVVTHSPLSMVEQTIIRLRTKIVPI